MKCDSENLSGLISSEKLIIHQPEILTSEGTITSWAAIEYENRRPGQPELLWYRFPESYREFISEQSDAFLLPGMMLALHLGEDIEVRGRVSPKLAKYLIDYLRVLSVWMPEYVRPIEITCQKLASIDARPTAIGSFFSGGVDSTFTLWKNLPTNQPIPEYQITHALYVQGMDLIHKWADIYQRRFQHFQASLSDVGVTLLRVETNANRAIIGRFPQFHFYSTPLLGAVHALGGLFKRIYVPGTWHHSQFLRQPSAANPLVEGLLSSDNLEVIQHGASHWRVEKLEAIADWAFAQQNLKVCNNIHERKTFNCSRCEKCTRTLIVLYLLGKGEEFETFKKPFLKDRDIFRWARSFDPSRNFVPETIRFVKVHNRRMIPVVYLALVLGYMRYWLVRLTPRFVRRPLRRFGFFRPLWLDDMDYEMPDVLHEIKASASGRG